MRRAIVVYYPVKEGTDKIGSIRGHGHHVCPTINLTLYLTAHFMAQFYLASVDLLLPGCHCLPVATWWLAAGLLLAGNLPTANTDSAVHVPLDFGQARPKSRSLKNALHIVQQGLSLLSGWQFDTEHFKTPQQGR